MVSFRVADQHNWEGRYAAVEAAIRTASERHWKDTSSFYVIESALDARALAVRLKNYIDPNSDIVLIRSLESRTAFVIGAVHDEALFALMPYCKRI